MKNSFPFIGRHLQYLAATVYMPFCEQACDEDRPRLAYKKDGITN